MFLVKDRVRGHSEKPLSRRGDADHWDVMASCYHEDNWNEDHGRIRWCFVSITETKKWRERLLRELSEKTILPLRVLLRHL